MGAEVSGCGPGVLGLSQNGFGFLRMKRGGKIKLREEEWQQRIGRYFEYLQSKTEQF